MRSKLLNADATRREVPRQGRFVLGSIAMTLALAGVGALFAGCLKATLGPLGPVLIGAGPRLGILATVIGGKLFVSAARDGSTETHRVVDLLLAALLFGTGSLGLAAGVAHTTPTGIETGLELLMALSGAALFFMHSNRTD